MPVFYANNYQACKQSFVEFLTHFDLDCCCVGFTCCLSIFRQRNFGKVELFGWRKDTICYCRFVRLNLASNSRCIGERNSRDCIRSVLRNFLLVYQHIVNHETTNLIREQTIKTSLWREWKLKHLWTSYPEQLRSLKQKLVQTRRLLKHDP